MNSQHGGVRSLGGCFEKAGRLSHVSQTSYVYSEMSLVVFLAWAVEFQTFCALMKKAGFCLRHGRPAYFQTFMSRLLLRLEKEYVVKTYK